MMHKTKNHASSYIYSRAASDYDRHLINTMMTAERVNKHSEEFAQVVSEVKRRQISSTLSMLWIKLFLASQHLKHCCMLRS